MPRCNPPGRGQGTTESASFGVADFTPHTPGQEGTPIRLTVTLVQANADFTGNGDLHFWLSTDTSTDIQPSDDPAVRFIGVDDPDGLDDQLVSRFFLGSGTFVEVDDGQMDEYSFDLSPDASQYLRDRISNCGNIRIVISPADSTVAATYAGYTNSSWPGPALTIDFAEW